jgi:hypothetical protein
VAAAATVIAHTIPWRHTVTAPHGTGPDAQRFGYPPVTLMVFRCASRTRTEHSTAPQVYPSQNGVLVSTIIFDHLLPYLGADQASYWASVLMVQPL